MSREILFEQRVKPNGCIFARGIETYFAGQKCRLPRAPTQLPARPPDRTSPGNGVRRRAAASAEKRPSTTRCAENRSRRRGGSLTRRGRAGMRIAAWRSTGRFAPPQQARRGRCTARRSGRPRVHVLGDARRRPPTARRTHRAWRRCGTRSAAATARRPPARLCSSLIRASARAASGHANDVLQRAAQYVFNAALAAAAVPPPPRERAAARRPGPPWPPRAPRRARAAWSRRRRRRPHRRARIAVHGNAGRLDAGAALAARSPAARRLPSCTTRTSARRRVADASSRRCAATRRPTLRAIGARGDSWERPLAAAAPPRRRPRRIDLARSLEAEIAERGAERRGQRCSPSAGLADW